MGACECGEYEKIRQVRRLLWDWGQTLDLIRRKQDEMALFRMWATDADTLKAQALTGMPRGGQVSDPVARAVEQLEARRAMFEQAERDAQREIDERLRRKAVMDEIIATLPATQQRILALRYIDGHNWVFVGMKIGIEESNARRQERGALGKIAGYVNFEVSI